jgi:NADH-quinone oxidoreductase subunit G
MSVTATDTVTLEIDGRTVVAPKGTPLVLAAAQGGIEIPIFCYEPRLGPPVGACRMCLVEVEGMPKLQAACTMTATDGMKVHTRSEQAAAGQHAVLEFILLNHPLDCPVCDKGGECPLQDLTYRYGPGNTRFHLPKRTYEKPIEISPLIGLDRERCILCYRCTRFSQDVAEDEQLIARQRGANSLIATFEERPYLGPFSGNVVELCPVGALTSSEYRFKARPWEIVNVPTVCGLCPVGCNTWASVREGSIQRVLSRDRVEVDEGWLCDKGRFAHGHLRDADRYTSPLVRGPRGLEETSFAEAAESVARRLSHFVHLNGPRSVAVVASGEQSNEEAHAWAELVRGAGGGLLVGCGDAASGAWERLDPYAARIADIDRADVVVVAGDRALSDAAGVVELRVRAAARRGARLVLAGAGGSGLERHASRTLATRGDVLAAAFDELRDELERAERPVVLVTDPCDLGRLARLAHEADLHRKPGGVLPLPLSPNERGVRAAGFDDDPEEVLARAEAGELEMLVLLGDADPISRWPQSDRWRAAVQGASSVVCVTMFPNEATGWAHLIVPATGALEKEGTFTNLEGRTQRLRPTLPLPQGMVDEIALLSAAAPVVGIELPAFAAGVHRALAAARPFFAERSWEEAAARHDLPPRVPAEGKLPKPPKAEPARGTSDGLVAAAWRPLFSGTAVERTPRLAFQRPDAVGLAVADAERLGIAAGDRVRVRHAAGETTGTAAPSRTQSEGTVRFPFAGGRPSGACTVEKVEG